MSTTYRALVKTKGGKDVVIKAGHRGPFTLSGDQRPISSDLLGLALYLDVVNHKDIEVVEIDGHPSKPPKAKTKPARVKAEVDTGSDYGFKKEGKK